MKQFTVLESRNKPSSREKRAVEVARKRGQSCVHFNLPVDWVDGALLDVVEDEGADEERGEADRHRRHVQHAEGVPGLCKRENIMPSLQSHLCTY